MHYELDLASVAALIGETSRATILAALLGGEALPATELAYRAQITSQTASSHLAKLLEGDLIAVTTVGRHRYYSLKNQEVAQILETLQLIAPAPANRPARVPKISPELCHARTCYDHLAGKLGVTLTNAFVDKAYLIQDEQLYILSDTGQNWLESYQIDTGALQKKRRKFAYACLDWSERRFHLAGSLGAAIATLFLENEWVKRLPHSRAITITPAGEKILKDEFSIQLGS